MQISKEAKVGFLTVVSIGLLVLGFSFLNGKNLFKRTKKVYAVFTDSHGLEKGNSVRVKGTEVGKIEKTGFVDASASAVLVTIKLDHTVKLPKNSVGYIATSITGSGYINIETGDATEYINTGDTLLTKEWKNSDTATFVYSVPAIVSRIMSFSRLLVPTTQSDTSNCIIAIDDLIKELENYKKTLHTTTPQK